MPEETNPTFHLGLTMAGAVSAGCYTAGVVDYLFEVLDLWDRAKKGTVPDIPKELVPKHNVVIDAMGGTSAGGMATIMTVLYALNGKINPVRDIPEDPRDHYNVLYDSWIHMDDDEKLTFEKLWETEDLENGRLKSILNSTAIDNIAKKAFRDIDDDLDFEQHITENLPEFVSKDLEVLLAHTLLRGIPLSVNFRTKIARKNKTAPKHNTFEHFLMSHFKLNHGKAVDESNYLWLNPYHADHANKMTLSTISTGAFPLGLAYREFDQGQFTDDYIRSIVKRIIYGKFGTRNPDENGQIDLNNFPSLFESITVDGGAINNEPYREVESILKKRYLKKDSDYQDFGMIMIDPFPDNDDIKREYKKPESLVHVIPNLIQTLWNQSKVKRKEMLEQYSTDYFRGVIYPRKHFTKADGSYSSRDKNPITSASFGAFGGFLDINFRVHDFFLGRNNARNFVQYFGSFPYDPTTNNVHPIHESWTEAMIEKFKIKRTVDGKETLFLPLVPDLNLVIENKKPGENRYNYTFKEKPKYNPQGLIRLKKKINQRFAKVIESVLMEFEKSKAPKKANPISNEWLDRIFKPNIWKRIKSGVANGILKVFKKPVKNGLASMATKSVIKMALENLEDMGILEKPDS